MFEGLAKAGLKKIIREKMVDKKLNMRIEDLIELIEKFTDNEININLLSNNTILFEDNK